MIEIKFKNFLVDNEEYDQAEALWLSLFDELLASSSNSCDWDVWFNGLNGDGSKNRTGNPIFTRLNKSSNKGLRVIQEEAESDDDFHIGAWMDRFDDQIDELVISCVLSNKTIDIAKKLIKAYVVDGHATDKMNTLIESLI